MNKYDNDEIEDKKINKVQSKKLKEKNVNKIIKNNKNKKLFEIKLILCQKISSKIYYKLLMLKISPLFSNDNKYFILFDGLYYLHENSIITIVDYGKNKEMEEKIFAVSNPDLEKNIDIYSIPLKEYIIFQNNLGYTLSKELSFNISFKLFNIYILVPKEKEKKKKLERAMSLMKEIQILESEEDSENNDLEKNNTKIDKTNYIGENTSVASQQTISSYIKGFSGLNLNNKKKDNFNEYKDFNQIKRIIYIDVILYIVIFIFQYFHIRNEESNIIDFHDSFIKYRKFSKYYFQLLPLTLSLSCVQSDTDECNNLISYHSSLYYEEYPEIDYDISLLSRLQAERIANKILEKRTILPKIHNLIGDKMYEEYFGATVNYTHITQTITNGYYNFDLNFIETKFYDSIYVMINYFYLIYSYNETDSYIYLLNKTENPFIIINNLKITNTLNDYQRDIYELVLNYKIYAIQFDIINQTIQALLYKTSFTIQVLVYFYLHLNYIMILLAPVLLYFYIKCFENVIIKIISYVHNTINIKSDSFKFSEIFIKKLDNLEIILNFYTDEPITAIHNLNNIYNKYQQYCLTKNKKDSIEASKKGNKNTFKEDNKDKKLFYISKSQKIIIKKEINFLKLFNKYFIIILIILIISIVLYIYLIILWLEYFKTKNNLYSFLDKNIKLETSLYRAINIYYLIIFNNFSLKEISKNIYNNIYNEKEPIYILKSFYEDLKLVYDSQKEKDELDELYEVFEKESNFSCKVLFKKNEEFLEEINETLTSQKLSKIKDKYEDFCKNTIIEEIADSKGVFTRHFHLINNGLLKIKDSSYEGLINHLKEGKLGEITLFFSNVVIFLNEIIFHKPNKKTTNNVLALLSRNIKTTAILFILIICVIIIIIIFFVIAKIKKYCAQILLLKNVFKIADIQEN